MTISSTRTNNPPSLWRDLARRTKSVDELCLQVSAGSLGWLLSDVVVAAVPLPAATTGDPVESRQHDPKRVVVQVHPGLHPKVTEASQAAVLYDADDMLEQGLRVRADSAASVAERNIELGEEVSTSEARFKTSMIYTVEGFQQFLRSLAASAATQSLGSSPLQLQLPPHVHLSDVLAEAEVLIRAISDPSQKDIKRYVHFDQFFTFQWEYLLPLDALDVAFQYWRLDLAQSSLKHDFFHEHETWEGLYHCTQGPTNFRLKIRDVTRRASGARDGHDHVVRIEADLSFEASTLSSSGTLVAGRYEYRVAGELDVRMHSLRLDPVRDSWKQTPPEDFIMVGLHGLATPNGNTDGSHRFAGEVPSFGCDSFELKLRRSPATSQDAAAATPTASPQSALLARLSQAIILARDEWRDELDALLVRESNAKKKASSGSGGKKEGTNLKMGASMAAEVHAQVAQLLAAAGGAAGDGQQITFEVASTDEETGTQTVVLRLGDQEAQLQLR
jgi:hypothetical protein